VGNPVVTVMVWICAIVGAVMVYALIVGAVASAIVRGVKAHRPSITSSPNRPDVCDRRGQDWHSVKGWESRDPDWATIVVLLGSSAVAARTQPFVDFANRQVDWDGLLLAASEWDRRDRMLIHVAYDLTSRATTNEAPAGLPRQLVSVADLVIDLDQSRADLVQAAVNVRRGNGAYKHARKLAARIN
jgi:hypothetical protein